MAAKQTQNKRSLRMFGLSLDAANELANWVYLIAGTIAVIATALTVAASFAMWRTSTAISEEKDRELARFTAQANQRAASLEESTAQARAEQARLAESNAKLGIQLEQERKERLLLQQKLEWRHLTGIQRFALEMFSVNNKVPIIITSMMSDVEAETYAHEFADAIRSGGQEVKERKTLFSQPVLGMHVSETPTAASATFQNTLHGVGIPFSVRTGRTTELDSLEIIIGSKPSS